jgi:hypothetical protein
MSTTSTRARRDEPTNLGAVEGLGRGGGAALYEVGAVPVPGPAYLLAASQSPVQ